MEIWPGYSRGEADYTTVKYDSGGVEKWVRSYKGSGYFSSIDFGNVYSDFFYVDSITIPNNSMADLILDTTIIQFEGITVNHSSSVINPGDTCKIYISYDPESIGDKNGYIVFGFNDNSLGYRVDLSADVYGIFRNTASIKDIACGKDAIFAVTADSGSLYRSTDKGVTWVKIFQSISPSWVGHIAVSPRGTLFVSTGFVDIWGLYRSTDEGMSWEDLGIGCGIGCIICDFDISPSGIILVGGTFIGEGPRGGWDTGVWRSSDDGITWEISGGGGSINAFFSDQVVAGFGGDSRYGSWCNTSTDGGVSWFSIPSNMTSAGTLTFNTSGKVFAGNGDGIFVSADLCTTWTKKSEIVPEDLLALPNGKMLAGINGGGIYLFSEDGDILGTLNEGLTNLNVHTLAMDSLNGHVYAGTDSGVFRIRQPLSSQYISQEGWNLSSFPYSDEGKLKSEIYPNSVSNAFYYQGTYKPNDTVYHCKGYWVKCSEPDTQKTFFGHTSCDTIDVNVGWNIIGSICVPVSVNTIQSEPSGIITSQFFGYNGNDYYESNIINPWKGYWVKVNQGGRLILSATSSSTSLNRISIVASSEQPPPPPNGEFQNPPAKRDEIPNQFALEQNYPNPFNPTTLISYQLTIESWVTIKVYNVLGQEVVTLMDGLQVAGYKSVEWNAERLPSGIYFYRMTAGSYIDTKKLLLLK